MTRPCGQLQRTAVRRRTVGHAAAGPVTDGQAGSRSPRRRRAGHSSDKEKIMGAIPCSPVCSPERPVPARRFAPFTRSWFFVGLLVVGSPLLGVIEPASGQTPRRLWNTELVEAKTGVGSGGTGKQASAQATPKTAASASAPSKQERSPSPARPAKPAPTPQYTSAASAPKPLAENDAIIGITVWRMRPAAEETPRR